MRITSLWLALLCVLTTTACSRQPSDKAMARKSKSYFKHYGHKYKTTEFGLSKITSARVNATQEWHKKLVEGDITLTMSDGSTTDVRCMFLRDDPFGWKIVSWENLH